MTIEDRYKQALNQDLRKVASNTVRKFTFMLKNIGVDFIHSKLYDHVLDSYADNEIFTSQFFGTPMWDNLILDTVKGGVNLRIDMVLMDVSMSKNIIKTPI